MKGLLYGSLLLPVSFDREAPLGDGLVDSPINGYAAINVAADPRDDARYCDAHVRIPSGPTL